MNRSPTNIEFFTNIYKMRYPRSRVFDSYSASTLLDEFTSSQLGSLFSPSSHIPSILLVSGPNEVFVLERQRRRSSLEKYLDPIKTVKAALNCKALNPIFLVLTMSSAILHEFAFPELMECILILLENRYSVHLQKIWLPDHGIPQNRTIVVLLASSLWAAVPLGIDKHISESDSCKKSKTVRHMIGDLSFRNTRTDRDSKTSSASKHSNAECGLRKHIHNHQTRRQPCHHHPIDLDSTATTFTHQRATCFTHPSS